MNWARKETKKIIAREQQCDIVFQTGVNNIINTNQNDENIIYQIRNLIKENAGTKHNIFFTSIIPCDIHGSDTTRRIKKINLALRQVVEEEGGIFMDLDIYFTRQNRLNRELFYVEREGLLHLNEMGRTVLAHAINLAISKVDLIESNRTPVFQWERNRYRGRLTQVSRRGHRRY